MRVSRVNLTNPHTGVQSAARARRDPFASHPSVRCLTSNAVLAGYWQAGPGRRVLCAKNPTMSLWRQRLGGAVRRAWHPKSARRRVRKSPERLTASAAWFPSGPCRISSQRIRRCNFVTAFNGAVWVRVVSVGRSVSATHVHVDAWGRISREPVRLLARHVRAACHVPLRAAEAASTFVFAQHQRKPFCEAVWWEGSPDAVARHRLHLSSGFVKGSEAPTANPSPFAVKLEVKFHSRGNVELIGLHFPCRHDIRRSLQFQGGPIPAVAGVVLK